jgi:hypothetical protein
MAALRREQVQIARQCRCLVKRAMIDLHQGFSGAELKEVSPTLTSLLVVQLDAASALLRGQLRRAARAEWAAARLLGRLVRERVRGTPTK